MCPGGSFSRTGRLGLYFENEFDKVVGKAATLAAVLEALADGPLRGIDIAKAIRASTGSTSQYLDRLGDVVRRLAWRFVVAAVDADGHVTFLDPKKATVAKAVTLGPRAELKNLLAWL